MEIPDIIDNSIEGSKLSDILNRVLSADVSAEFATAYFNLAGFALLKDNLTKVKHFRLLLGREPLMGEPRPSMGALVGEDLRADTEDAMGQRETPHLIKELVDFLNREMVQVRLHTKQFLHAKAYVIEGLPFVGTLAIHGSSNFTSAGLTRQGELNSVRKEASAVRGIKDWFDRYWTNSDDFKGKLIELLSDFTIKYTPFDIYMKALYEYFKDKFQMEVKVDGPSPIFLADFQRDGYLAAKDILETYGGVMLADSVGLGKTYLGLKLLDDYAYRLRQKALVVCPAQLRDLLWEPKLRDLAIRADIVSQEELGRNTFDIQKFLEYDVIVVDESHNFRNSIANRYDNLSRLLTLSKPKKLILLTATPVNNSIFDLFNQVQLITRGHDDFFSSMGIRSLWGYFLQVEANKDHLYDLLEEITVRRSRHYIRKNYPQAIIDGKPVRFPGRGLHTVRYSLEQTYAGLYQEIADTIENLNLASYSLDAYRRQVRQGQLALWETLKERLLGQGWEPKEAEDFTMRLGRQLSLVHILKTLYLKRLESSVEALRISLDRQKRFQEKFLEMLRNGRLLDAATYRRIFVWNGSDDESTDEGEIEELLTALPEVDPAGFDLEAIERAVEQDVGALSQVLDRFPEPVAKHDDKLRSLKEQLLELRDKKLVIFTYFRDTARYLYCELQADEDFQAKLRRRMSIVDGGVDARERTDRVIRFSPIANERRYLKGTNREIDLLISTDVLSEGQNLQDADTVINYDLHWNPVRMIQRAGRIDRIGSEWDMVHIFNFFPEDNLEALLKLVERLYEKLDAIKRSVGLDASTLGEAVDPKEFNAIRRIEAQDLTILDELEEASELTTGEFVKQELLDFLKKIGEERLRRIPLGVGSGMRREGQRGLFVYLKGGDRHFWCYYDSATEKITERKLDIVHLIRCNQVTPRAEPEFDVYEIIDRVKDRIVNRFKQLQTSPLTFKAPQNQIVNLLQTVRGQYEVADLLAYYATPLPNTLLRPLRKMWDEYRRNGNVADLTSHLTAFAQDNPVAPVAPPIVGPGEGVQKEDLKLVCWLAVT
ncbi:MAG: phospholipase D-like domain-containing protein [Chloroflexi bacterium]|nr:phospholipase D-like domain-containing protein [Chloroflexota bacterium]MCL5074438.1 phospholipase D-like domain-containing protein [Chloroflexota bacterium]